MDYKALLNELLSSLKISKKKFAEQLGLSQGNVSDWFNRPGYRPSISALKRISDTFNVNLNWLVTGEGDMYIVAPAREGTLSRFIRLPIVGDIAAGAPIEIIPDEDLRYIEISLDLLRYPPPYLVFNVAGESMKPFLEPGDVVVCSQDWCETDINGKIMAFRTSDGITVKTLCEDYQHKATWLMPINNQYTPTCYCEDDEEIVMIGILDLIIREINR